MNKAIINPGQLAEQEKNIRDHLSQGRWRKARDEAKSVLKQDPGRFLPLIIEANVGLAREMASRGLTSEAAQVLTYLRTIAPPETVRLLEVEMKRAAPTAKSTTAELLASLDDPSFCTDASWRSRTADWIVLRFDFAPNRQSALPGPSGGEVQSIWQALHHVSQQQWKEAGESLRPVSARSPFRNWKLLIKGLIAYYQGEFERAGQFWEGIEKDTVPDQAQKVYRLWTEPVREAREVPEPHLMQAFCTLARQPGLAPLLLAAEKKGNPQNPIEPYAFLRRSLPAFPSLKPDWVGALTDFCCQSMLMASEQGVEQTADFFEDLEENRAWKSDAERLVGLRTFCFLYTADSHHEPWQDYWKSYVHLQEKFYGSSPRLRSIAHLAEASCLVFAGCSSPLPGNRKEQAPLLKTEHASRAIRLLECSMQEDPTQKRACQLLADLYRQLDRKKDLGRLLEIMARQFPGDKDVLCQAAGYFLERKAVTKAIQYVEQARRIDRLDPKLMDDYVRMHFHLARQHFEKRSFPKGREVIEQLLTGEYALATKDNLDRSRWTICLRRGILELSAGFAGLAEEWLAKAEADAPSKAAFLLQAHILWVVYQSRQGYAHDDFSKKLERYVQSRIEIGDILWLLRVYRYISSLTGLPPLSLAENLILKGMKKAARSSFSRQDLLHLLELLSPNHRFFFGLDPYFKNWLKKDPADPLIRYYQMRSADPESISPGKREKTYREILKEAMARRDETAIRLLENELRLKRPEEFYLPPPDFEDFQEELDELWGDGAGEPPDLDTLPPIPLPDILQKVLNSTGRELICAYKEMVSTMGPAEKKIMRQGLTGTIPKADLDFIFGRKTGKGQGMKRFFPPAPPEPPQPGKQKQARQEAEKEKSPPPKSFFRRLF